MVNEKLIATIINCLNAPTENKGGTLKGKICFYPGSFNPWHQGHQSCVNLHLQTYPDIDLLILPDMNPQKMLPLEDIHHLENILKKLSQEKQVTFSSVFLKNARPNPTSSWITHVKKCFPKVELGILMGLDAFLSLPTWIETDKLLSSLSFIEVVPRQLGDHPQKDLLGFIQALTSKYQALKIAILPNHPFENISSTALRQK